MSAETLRAAIETALKRRDGYDDVSVGTRDYRDARDRWSATTNIAASRVEVWRESEIDALRALALACGLRPDGSDPAAEVETLRRERAATTALLAEIWHEVATGHPPPVNDRKTWLAIVNDRVAEANDRASMAAQLTAMSDARNVEVATLTRERDEAWASAEAAEQRANGAARAWRDVCEIVAGRTTPPTDEEIAAHRTRGGEWLVLGADARDGAWVSDATTREDIEIARKHAVRWVAIRDGRPCAWPTTEGGR